MTGRVKTVNPRGFGFIIDGRDIDFYFHFTEFNQDWKVLLAHFVAGRVVIVNFEVDITATNSPRAKCVSVKEVVEK